MEVIASHTNADFDTIASMLAAKKLYPGAHLLFTGSLERDLKRALSEIDFPYPIERPREIDLDSIDRLILVDIRQSSRIGPLSRIVSKEGLDIHIYDHHPDGRGDIRGSVEVVESCGSTTTILVLIIKERGIDITPHEATILMTGIYEDTGFLTYPSTTVKDYSAASFLLQKGADLVRVAQLLRKEMTPEDVSILDEFLKSTTTYTIGGVDVLIAEGHIEGYRGDISALAHRIRDIEDGECVFVMADTGERVHVVARSTTPRIDVGRIARILGGGGHPTASSATLKGMTLVQARERLLDAIRKVISPERTAGDIMSSPPITVPADTTLEDTIEVMRRFNINAVVVTEEGEFRGVITRQVLDKAIAHGLGSARVEDFMTTEVDLVEVTRPIEEIRKRVLSFGQRLLPVVSDRGKVVGVITRTDMLRLLHEEVSGRAESSRKVRYLTKQMKELLPQWVVDILREAGRIAESLSYRAYVVGGFVRDLFLGRENLDIDIVIEGDGIVFARGLAGRLNARITTHERFKTAVLLIPDGFRIDVATARLEYYEHPGALPSIEVSSLKLDLYRRDFTINALAVALNPDRFGELIDFFGGQRDIKDRTIRVIHNLSFVEDPTRALRAVRFAEKFAFRIGGHTLNLIKNAVRFDILKGIAGSRILYELKNILEEERSKETITSLHSLGLLRLIHPGIRWDEEMESLYERTKEALSWHRLLYTDERIERWSVLFLALTDSLPERELIGLAERLTMARKKIELLRMRKDGIIALENIHSEEDIKPSHLHTLLSPLPVEIILYLMGRTDSDRVRRDISTYITRLRYIRPHLNGNDLKRLGLPEGPVIGKVLKILLHKRLDGYITTREDEERFVREGIPFM